MFIRFDKIIQLLVDKYRVVSTKGSENCESFKHPSIRHLSICLWFKALWKSEMAHQCSG